MAGKWLSLQVCLTVPDSVGKDEGIRSGKLAKVYRDEYTPSSFRLASTAAIHTI